MLKKLSLLGLGLAYLGLTACEDQKAFEPAFQTAKEKYANEQYQAAFADFKHLAEKGYAPAQLEMVAMLLEGKGVRRNEPLAVEHLKKAAEKGNATAQVRLGQAYYSGNLTTIAQDYHTALKWFNAAAEQKNAEAQYQLGKMFQNGWGTRQNNNTAKEWFGKACDNGSQAGCERYKALGEQGY